MANKGLRSLVKPLARLGLVSLALLMTPGCATSPFRQRCTPDEKAVVACLGYYLRACEVPSVDANGKRTEGVRFGYEGPQLDPRRAELVRLAIDHAAAIEEAVDASVDSGLLRRLSEDHARLCALWGVEEGSFFNAAVEVQSILIHYPQEWALVKGREDSVLVPVDEAVTPSLRRSCGGKRALRVLSAHNSSIDHHEATIEFLIELSPLEAESPEQTARLESSLFRQCRRLQLERYGDGKWRVVDETRGR